jgi:tRNA nucleotidyltransferase (CCA-adding enzyme)
MQAYIVGGYVRDRLLGLEPKDRDWVVVGATPEQMLDQGYRLVGKDFPVFLHPLTKEVYALARTERSGAQQHQGRQVFTDPGVTLREDLERRDLTINAMAMTETEELIDPLHGAEDLQSKTLRHVGPGFRDDPVRVLRTARLAARYGFSIAGDTRALIRAMLENRELDGLVPERVWSELQKALEEEHPDCFVATLRELGALRRVFPEIDRLFGVPQPENYHPEIDTGIHTLMALRRACELSPDPLVRFGTLVHDLGKGVTPKAELPRHIGHEKAGVDLVDALCERYRAPSAYRRFGRLCAEYHLHMHRAAELRPKTLLRLFTDLGAFRHPEALARFLLVCQADAQGREGLHDAPYPQADYVKTMFAAAAGVSSAGIARHGLSGEAFGRELHRLRIQAVKDRMATLGHEAGSSRPTGS